MPNSRKETTNKPVQKFQLRGVSASIFRNRAENGASFHKVTISRTYKEGDQFKTTSTFGRDDLPLVEALARQAWFDILKREQNRYEANE